MGNIFHKLGDYLEEYKKKVRIKKENAKKLPLDTILNINRFIDENRIKSHYLSVLLAPFYISFWVVVLTALIKYLAPAIFIKIVPVFALILAALYQNYFLFVFGWIFLLLYRGYKNKKLDEWVDETIELELKRLKHGKR